MYIYVAAAAFSSSSRLLPVPKATSWAVAKSCPQTGGETEADRVIRGSCSPRPAFCRRCWPASQLPLLLSWLPSASPTRQPFPRSVPAIIPGMGHGSRKKQRDMQRTVKGLFEWLATLRYMSHVQDHLSPITRNHPTLRSPVLQVCLPSSSLLWLLLGVLLPGRLLRWGVRKGGGAGGVQTRMDKRPTLSVWKNCDWARSPTFDDT